MQALIAATDKQIAAQPQVAQVSGDPEKDSLVIGSVDIAAAISIGIIVLQAVKVLLWWKPSWQTAIANVILYLQTFEAIVP